MTDSVDTIQGGGNAIRFSVVIPVYNAENTIARALDSVLAQSYTNYEIIVVDDASTDGTAEILQTKYAPHIKYIQKIFNSGGGSARNSGMNAATGEFIAFLDADDTWHKDRLQLINHILDATPGISLFYHPYSLEPIANKAIPANVVVYKLPFIKLIPGNIIATPCTVIRNDLSFRFEPTMRYMEDFDLWLRIGYKHKLYFIDIPLTQLFRPVLSAGGVSADKWAMRKGEMHTYVRMVKLNPAFLLILPILLLSSIGKHFIKYISK